MHVVFRVIAVSVVTLVAQVVAEESIEFNRDIRPILSKNCLICHGPDQQSREADLRLDSFEDATANDVIVAGNAELSEFMRRIRCDDPSEIMPPPDADRTLTDEEISLLERWIDQGAHYQQHWAWTPLRRPEIAVARGDTDPSKPSDLNATQQRDAAQYGAAMIDAMLAAGWADHDVQPVAIASARDRLRRLSFDLRGLPPSRDDVIAFERDPSDHAFSSFRDRWMSELAYAEHQAVRWLDLVRWADTSGFVSDEPIASGAYRAWVIQAIDQNMPFDQFSIAQLAGDLLPDPSDEQLIASGYNRIVNTNCEAGAIELEQLYKLKGEHVRALGTVWMGMTTGCAECHDHKFDPFTANDYYSLAAFFDDLVQAGVYTPGDRREPLHYVHADSESSAKDRHLSQQIYDLRAQIHSISIDGCADWEDQTRKQLHDKDSRADFIWAATMLPAPRILTGDFLDTEIDGAAARLTVANSGVLNRHHAAEWMTGYLSPDALQTDKQADAWFINAWIDPNNRPEMIGFQISNGRYGRLGWNTANYETYYWGNDTSGELTKSQPWSAPIRVERMGDLPMDSGWVRLQVPFDKQIKPVGGQTFERVGMAWLHCGGRIGWGDSGLSLRADKVTALTLGETAFRRWWEQPMNREIYENRAEIVAKSIKKHSTDRDEIERAIVVDAFRESTQPESMHAMRCLESELFMIRSRAMPVLVSRQSTEKKTTRLVNRGDYQDETGPLVTAALPEFLNNAATDETTRPLSRLDLAHWLFQDDNPIVARVFVNRLWHQFYGHGISTTLDDSGTQGDWPSHLALLDWLACEFRDSGWNRDHLVRLLTSTHAYQLTSTPSVDLRNRDPSNRWFARQERFRLDAESIRDSTLLAAGLLKTTIDVPKTSFFPYQPDPYWTRSDKVMYGSRHMLWETSPGQTQYDRSVYTFWKRQNIHPTLLAFDAPTRQECTAQRNITNTPGQALALLNDPIFVEAARVLAIRICEPAGHSDEDRIVSAYSFALQRRPATAESLLLLQLLSKQRQHYSTRIDEAQSLVAIGQAAMPAPEQAAEIAAWTAVTRAILNSHEFLTRP